MATEPKQPCWPPASSHHAQPDERRLFLHYNPPHLLITSQLVAFSPHVCGLTLNHLWIWDSPLHHYITSLMKFRSYFNRGFTLSSNFQHLSTLQFQDVTCLYDILNSLFSSSFHFVFSAWSDQLPSTICRNSEALQETNVSVFFMA